MVASVRSQVPTRLPGGAATDGPNGPLADSGYGNPAFYHQFFDDFDYTLGFAGLYTVSKGSTGTAVHAAGDGGTGTLTTAASANDYVALQLPAASFQLPQGTTYPSGTLGKKLFYGARFQCSTVANIVVKAGLGATDATIFTANHPADGIWFQWSGSALNLITSSASTQTTWTIPPAAYTLAAATYIDVAFYIDWYGNINVFTGAQLFGYIPQSGSGSASATTGVSLLPTVGRCLQIAAGSWTVSAANLNVTFGLQSTNAVANTSTIDFHFVQKER